MYWFHPQYSYNIYKIYNDKGVIASTFLSLAAFGNVNINLHLQCLTLFNIPPNLAGYVFNLFRIKHLHSRYPIHHLAHRIPLIRHRDLYSALFYLTFTFYMDLKSSLLHSFHLSFVHWCRFQQSNNLDFAIQNSIHGIQDVNAHFNSLDLPINLSIFIAIEFIYNRAPHLPQYISFNNDCIHW